MKVFSRNPLLAVVLACCFAPRVLLAHAIVVTAVPAAKSTVAAGTVPIALEFNSRIDLSRSRLSLIDAEGATTVLPVDPAAPENTIRASATDLAPGTYRLEWYVLSADGHITRGNLQFSVAGGAAPER
jgi:methionine-rich copper-binding protein CopC